MQRSLLLWMLPLIAALAPLADSSQAIGEVSAEWVFNRAKAAVVQVRIINLASGEQSSLGSGFFVSPEGYGLTNYHVVSDVVQEPDLYRAEFVADGGASGALDVVGIDVINDLALIRADYVPAATLSFADTGLNKGERLFAIGNPYDLGTTIVEGSYSGVMEDSLHRRIHFTGALNPGMSGGPALNEQGAVVGVNVSTAGNQISFLVRGKLARTLFEGRSTAGNGTVEDAGKRTLKESMREQLLGSYDRLLGAMISGTLETKELGRYRVPGKIGEGLKCWGNVWPATEKRPYELSVQRCSAEETVFLSSDHETTLISYEHKYVTSDRLNTLAFYNLMSDLYGGQGGADTGGGEEDLTNYECSNGFVENGGLLFRSALCVRGFVKYPGIYDIMAVVASLDGKTSGLVSVLRLGGVGFDKGMGAVRRYLEAMGPSGGPVSGERGP